MSRLFAGQDLAELDKLVGRFIKALDVPPEKFNDKAYTEICRIVERISEIWDLYPELNWKRYIADYEEVSCTPLFE